MRETAALLLLAHGFTAPQLAAQAVEFGLVDSLSAGAAGWVIHPGGDSVPARLLFPLYSGDLLRVTAPAALVRVKPHGGAAVWVCGSGAARANCQPEFRVPDRPPRARGGGAIAAAFETFGRPVLDLFRRGQWGRQVGAYVRFAGGGEAPLAIPLLDVLPSVGAGRRELDASWHGGRAPFTVRLVHVDRRVEAARRDSLPTSAVRLGQVTLTPGEWLLELRDAGGTTLQRPFRVVPATEVPSPQAELLEGYSGTARTLLEAGWLAAKADGRWAWEAYLRLASLDDPTAVAFRQELAAGRIP